MLLCLHAYVLPKIDLLPLLFPIDEEVGHIISSIWNTVVWLMLFNFFSRIMTATAQSHLKEQQERKIKALSKDASSSDPSTYVQHHVSHHKEVESKFGCRKVFSGTTKYSMVTNQESNLSVKHMTEATTLFESLQVCNLNYLIPYLCCSCEMLAWIINFISS